MNEQMDPDNDGFNISLEDAEKLNKNMNILHFIRKYILSNNAKLFQNGLQSLIEASINSIDNYCNTSPFSGILPDNWKCAEHDKGILNAVADNGLNYLNQISNNPNYNFDKIEISFVDALDRVNYLCEFFRDFTSGNKNKKRNIFFNNQNNLNLSLNETLTKNPIENNQSQFIGLNQNQSQIHIQTQSQSKKINEESIKTPIDNTNIPETISQNKLTQATNKTIDYRRKTNKLIVNKDEKGDIIYPILINSSLQILNLGEINYDKISFHSEKNLFPIGFKSIREHSSMFKLGERTQYVCEILNGGNKPLYKITPMNDPENPIIKESSTGCWVIKKKF